jgi:penicillin-insensitive murein DD-endopeptidase
MMAKRTFVHYILVGVASSAMAWSSVGMADASPNSSTVTSDDFITIPNTAPAYSDENEGDDATADEMAGMPETSRGMSGDVMPQMGQEFFEGLFDVPTASVEQARGFYSKGSLVNASVVPLEGTGFIKIMRPRDRGYVTYEWMEVIKGATKLMHEEYADGEPLQIGDVAGRNGGQLAQHASHQNGLDGDVVYFRNNHHQQDPEDGSGFKELFVVDGKTISPNFDAKRNWRFINHLTDTNRLVRIFMDPVIKHELCDYSKKIGEYDAKGIEVLRHVRPYVNHRDHMHVRITCPAASTKCVAQTPVPAGSGCAEVADPTLTPLPPIGD